MKLNGIWSKVGGQKMKFSIVLAKKWVGKCPPCPPSSDVPDHIEELGVQFIMVFNFLKAIFDRAVKCQKTIC